jgi:DUF438 domain-containing protein
MSIEKILTSLLDCWDKPVVFADTEHIIRYMNMPARKHYAKWGDVMGKSLLDCHNEKSCGMIKDICERMKSGETEVMITDSAKHRVYMRAVRDEKGELLGYYERYEPPAKSF